MKEEVIEYINQNTHRKNLEELSTKEIASRFNLSTIEAYEILNRCAKNGLITKLDPVDNNKFECCGWIRNND